MRRRSAARASRARVCAFSFSRSASRAARHRSGVTMSGLAMLILGLPVSWAAPLVALHLVSGAGRRLSTSNRSSRPETVAALEAAGTTTAPRTRLRRHARWDRRRQLLVGVAGEQRLL